MHGSGKTDGNHQVFEDLKNVNSLEDKLLRHQQAEGKQDRSSFVLPSHPEPGFANHVSAKPYALHAMHTHVLNFSAMHADKNDAWCFLSMKQFFICAEAELDCRVLIERQHIQALVGVEKYEVDSGRGSWQAWKSTYLDLVDIIDGLVKFNCCFWLHFSN